MKGSQEDYVRGYERGFADGVNSMAKSRDAAPALLEALEEMLTQARVNATAKVRAAIALAKGEDR